MHVIPGQPQYLTYSQGAGKGQIHCHIELAVRTFIKGGADHSRVPYIALLVLLVVSITPVMEMPPLFVRRRMTVNIMKTARIAKTAKTVKNMGILRVPESRFYLPLVRVAMKTMKIANLKQRKQEFLTPAFLDYWEIESSPSTVSVDGDRVCDFFL